MTRCWIGRLEYFVRSRHIAPALRYRAASLALQGRVEEAHEVVARILKQTPG